MVNPHTLRGRRSCSISFLHKRVAVTFTAPSWVYIHSGTYRTNIKSHTKLIGHLSSSQQNETEIFHQWNHSKHTDGLNCCMSVHSHLSVITHLTIGLIKDNWRTNQLINQQTTNLQNLLENGLLWVSDSLTVKTSIFCTFTLQAVQTSNNQQTCKTSIKKKKKFSVTDWISDYWFILLRLCTYPQDIHVCSLPDRLTYSFSLPLHLCHPHHPLYMLFCSPTE